MIAQLLVHAVLALAFAGAGVYLWTLKLPEAAAAVFAVAALVVGRILPQPAALARPAPIDPLTRRVEAIKQSNGANER